MDSLSTQRFPITHSEERLEQVAQSLTALLKCSSCFVYASESHAMILEVQLSGSCWVS